MNNDVVRLFFRFGIKRSIRSSVFAPGKNRTIIFFLLESFASLKPAIKPCLHSSDNSGGSVSDGFDSDTLILLGVYILLYHYHFLSIGR